MIRMLNWFLSHTYLNIRSRTTYTLHTHLMPTAKSSQNELDNTIKWFLFYSKHSIVGLSVACLLVIGVFVLSFLFIVFFFFIFFIPLNDFWVGGSTFVPFSSNIRYIQCRSYAYRGSCCTFCSCPKAMFKTLCSL